ncbi:MAG: four-carbon acid sugar kinase family protein, partial [Alphaproteobacteria bacterium]
MTTAALPPGLLLSFYGDDFTGSAAVMEVMTFAGLPAVLFLGPPTASQLAEFTGYRAMGIAGIARAKDPAWMSRNLPDIFATLAGWQAPLAHYKVCSTFDSSPHVGSIGHAIDIGVPLLGGRWHPLLVAAPAIHRYQAFGNLFAVVDHIAYRLDRHPTMSRHPTTPMNEADVTRHLAGQTDRAIGLVDCLALAAGAGGQALDAALTQGAEVVAIDVLDHQTLVEAGRLIWQNRGERLFVVGSQGIEYALTAYWQDAGLIPPAPPAPNAGPVDNIIAVSGSCSP